MTKTIEDLLAIIHKGDMCTCHNTSCPYDCEDDHSHKQFSCDQCGRFGIIDAIKEALETIQKQTRKDITKEILKAASDVFRGDCSDYSQLETIIKRLHLKRRNND